MNEYISKYLTGEDIDNALDKAMSAVQPEELDELKEDLTKLGIVNVDFTNAITGQYIKIDGSIGESSLFNVKEIDIKKCERVYFTARGNVGSPAAISIKNPSGSTTPYTPVVIFDASTVKEYSYLATADGTLALCYYNNSEYHANIVFDYKVSMNQNNDKINNTLSSISSNTQNIIPLKNITKEVFGVEVTTNASGECILNGTATNTGGRNIILTDAFTLEAGTYTISTNSNSAKNVWYIEKPNSTLEIIASTSTGYQTFTLESQTECVIGTAVIQGKSFDNEEIYLQLEKGNRTEFVPTFTATDWISRRKNIVYTVDKNGGGDFTTIKEAVEEATKHMDVTVYVNSGIYDLIEEFGNDYFTNLGSGYAGLILKNRIRIIFSSRAKIVCNYTGDNTNVMSNFAVFNSGEYGFTLENCVIECSRIRYAVHDERNNNSDMYINTYKNCEMYIDNRNNSAWGSARCIGGGLGINGVINIDSCYFDSDFKSDTHSSEEAYCVSYHNAGDGEQHLGALSKVVIKNSYVGKSKGFLFSYMGYSENITKIFVNNCSVGQSGINLIQSSSVPHDKVNMELYKWNNEIRES